MPPAHAIAPHLPTRRKHGSNEDSLPPRNRWIAGDRRSGSPAVSSQDRRVQRRLRRRRRLLRHLGLPDHGPHSQRRGRRPLFVPGFLHPARAASAGAHLHGGGHVRRRLLWLPPTPEGPRKGNRPRPAIDCQHPVLAGNKEYFARASDQLPCCTAGRCRSKSSSISLWPCSSSPRPACGSRPPRSRSPGSCHWRWQFSGTRAIRRPCSS